MEVSEERRGENDVKDTAAQGNQKTLSSHGTMDRIPGRNGRERRPGVQLGVRRMAGDRRSIVLRGREGEEGWVVQAGKISACGLATLGIYNPPFAISLHLKFAFQTTKAHARGNDLTSLGSSKRPSRRLQDYYLISFLDITGPPPKEPLNLFYVPTLDLFIEAGALDTSKGLNTTRGHDRSGGEEDGDFQSVEELLLNTGGTQDWQRTGSSDKYVTGGSEGIFEQAAEGDRNSAGSSEGEHKEKSVAVDDSLVEDCNTQDAQREAGGSTGVRSPPPSARGAGSTTSSHIEIDSHSS
ncbi:hypothetical protein N7G274_010669 [Stereocaulon virgatum]|uniref:Uncharacterized protein n=1 Tax=Stereocaulon virgatum TaxID=373712 RepID=A0ABR3ZV26_9LECA